MVNAASGLHRRTDARVPWHSPQTVSRVSDTTFPSATVPKVVRTYCDTCLSAWETPRTENLVLKPHHVSYQSLYNSAQRGCPFCNEVLQLLPCSSPYAVRDEPAPCTEYRVKSGNPPKTFEVRFSSDWLAGCLLENDKKKEIMVKYSTVPVKAEELPEEWTSRAESKFREACWDQELAKRLWGEHTGSHQSFSLIQQWITHCDKHHQTCKGSFDAHWFPKRLIYIGRGIRDLRLHMPNIASWASDERYTTLSHCWGPDSSQVAKLTKDNLNMLQLRIHRERLPQTFRDAIDITKRLGISFIWIDSLCILQDDDEDWDREAASMSRIYANSYLNVSATVAKNGQQGCYRSRDSMKVAGLPVARMDPAPLSSWIDPNPEATSLFRFVRSDIWTTNVDRAPLNQRGWVLQERLLSPRVLHFSADQVLWECRENYACETFPNSIPPAIRGIGVNAEVYLRDFVPGKPATAYDEHREYIRTELWTTIVEAYSRMHLTYWKDKLVALSGIAREIAYLLDSEYVAGLWRCHLPYSLLWTAERGAHRPAKYVAPSWSWASVKGPIKYPLSMRATFMDYYTERQNDCATILEIGLDLVTPTDPFGQIRSGWIRIRGTIFTAPLLLPEVEDKRRTVRTIVYLTEYVPPLQASSDEGHDPEGLYPVLDEDDFHASIHIQLDEVKGTSCLPAVILPIRKYVVGGGGVHGILLRALPSGQFARLGTLFLDHDRIDEIMASFEEREIVIV